MKHLALAAALAVLPTLAWGQTYPFPNAPYAGEKGTGAPSTSDQILVQQGVTSHDPVGSPARMTLGTLQGLIGGLPFSGGTLTGPLTAPGITSTGAIAGNVTATGSTAARGMADRAADVINIADFGAKCDGATDDAAAINAATAAARTKPGFVSGQAGVKIVGPQGRSCLVQSSINMTGFTAGPVEVDLSIVCQTSGTPCIDASGSRWVHWDSVSIKGLQTNAPNIGLQVARTSSAQGNEHQADHLWILGYFTFAGLYNEAVEVSQWNHIIIYNQAPNAYALVEDGANHWNAQSAFTTIGLPVDVQNSFNDVTYIGGDFQEVGSSGVPIWMDATFGHRYIGSYAESVSGPACVEMYNNASTGSITDLKLDHLHCETTVPDVILVTGPYATPTINGLVFDDFYPEATNSVFKADAGITGITLNNPKVTIEKSQTVPLKVFDAPSLWTINGGDIWVPTTAYWTGAPASFSGCLAASGYASCAPTNPNPNGNMIVNGDMAIDQQNEGAQTSFTRYVDKWLPDTRGGLGAALGQRLTSAPSGFIYSLQMTESAAVTPSSAQAQNVKQFIEASSFNGAGWGTSGAQPLTCGFWAKASTTGDFPVALVNASATRSYVATFNIAAAGTWTHRSITIPGDTTAGAWATGANSVGAVMYFNLAAGSSFQTTSGAWQAGFFFTTSSAVQIGTIASATLNLTGVHCNFGSIDQGYSPLPYGLELARADRFYSKSLKQGTQVAQNAGTAGAVGVTLPYAQATFGSVSFPVRFPDVMYLNGGTGLPTIKFYSTGAASANCYNETQGRDSGAAAASDIGDSGFLATCTLVAGDAIGDRLVVQYTADSGH